MGIIEERMKIRERVIKEVGKWSETLDFKCTVVLIGSYARGNFNEWSDIDVVLISEIFSGNPIDRLKMIDFPPNFVVIPINLDELAELFKREDLIANDICKYGVFVRDDYKVKDKFCG